MLGSSRKSTPGKIVTVAPSVIGGYLQLLQLASLHCCTIKGISSSPGACPTSALLPHAKAKIAPLQEQCKLLDVVGRVSTGSLTVKTVLVPRASHLRGPTRLRSCLSDRAD